MKQYYQEKLHWVFNYTSKNFFYVVAKTLCLVVGLPLFAVSFVLDMVLTAVYMLFSFIPGLNIVVMALCKFAMFLFSWPFYICILTDLKAYNQASEQKTHYEIDDAEPTDSQQD